MKEDFYFLYLRQLCGLKILRLEEFIDDVRHGMALQLEPQGLLFAEVSLVVIYSTMKFCLLYVIYNTKSIIHFNFRSNF